MSVWIKNNIFIIKCQIYTFCVGEHLQHTTAGALHAALKNTSLQDDNATFNEFPSITRTLFYYYLNCIRQEVSLSGSSTSLI